MSHDGRKRYECPWRPRAGFRCPVPGLPGTITWSGRGMRVLDLACGDGRHSLRRGRARRGGHGLGPGRGRAGRRPRSWRPRATCTVDWRVVDLQGDWPEVPPFDAVLVFNYLDRKRMPLVHEALAPGGTLIMETFLATQRELGWGPTRDEHLLGPGRTGPADRSAGDPARTRGARAGGRGALARGLRVSWPAVAPPNPYARTIIC